MAHRVWLTRTQPAVNAEAQLARAAGFEPVVAPVLEIVAVPVRWPEIDPDVAVFVSVQAVRHTPDDVVRALHARSVRCLAMGEGTRAALAEVGLASEVADPQTSEGAERWFAPVLARHGTLQVLIVAGEGGREHLQNHLTAAGCVVARAAAYRRVPVIESEAVRGADGIDGIVVASGDGFQAVRRLWCGAGGDMRVAMVVPSERVARMARTAGFARVGVSPTAQPEAMIACLAGMIG